MAGLVGARTRLTLPVQSSSVSFGSTAPVLGSEATAPRLTIAVSWHELHFSATINKVKTRTNAQIWKHDFEKPEWMSLLALMFVVRDFMFFYPVVDDDLTYEEPTGTSKADRESRRVLPRQHDNDQLLRRAHEGVF